MKQAILVLLLTMLCACATTQTDVFSNEKNELWVGRSVDELIIANGEPSTVYMLDGGNRVFEYSKIDKKTANFRYFPTQSSVKDVTSSTDPRIKRLRDIHKKQRQESDTSCSTLFKVSASDIVSSWTTEGCN